MWRLLALLVVVAGPAWSITTVTGTIRLPDGTLATGKAFIDLTGTCVGAGGAIIPNPTKIASFTAGVFTVDLEPSSTCVPSQAYRVRYQIALFNTPLEFWNVPDSGTPVTIASVRIPGIPVTTGALGMAYVTGLICKGDLFSYNGTANIRVPCPTVANTVLKKDASAAAGVSWQPDSGATAYGRYSTTITPAATTWTVLGATHLLNSCALATMVWISNLAAEPNTVACNPTTFDVTITFLSAQTGDIYLTSDPVFVADNLLNGSLVSQVVAQSITASPITITHGLNAVVILRCYDGSGNRLLYDIGTRLSANALTVSFVGAPSGFCVAGR